MTSNVGTETIMSLCQDPELIPEPKGLRAAIQDDLLKVFKPAFLGRINIIPYSPLSKSRLAEIASIQLMHVAERLQMHHSMTLDYSDDVIGYLVTQCQDAGRGARQILEIIQHELLNRLSTEILKRTFESDVLHAARLSIKDNCIQVDIN